MAAGLATEDVGKEARGTGERARELQLHGGCGEVGPGKRGESGELLPSPTTE